MNLDLHISTVAYPFFWRPTGTIAGTLRHPRVSFRWGWAWLRIGYIAP